MCSNYALLSFSFLFSFAGQLWRNLPAEGWGRVWKRLPLLCLLWLLLALLSLQHLLGFLCDELFFRGYRRIGIVEPWFIVGIPRSGTTHLHRVLAGDPRFTSFTTWEALLAPSVSERYFYSLLGRLLAPLARVVAILRGRLLGEMDKIHELGLRQPEEDFLLLLWVGHCYLQAFVCPDSEAYWALGDFSRSVPPARRWRVLRYYRACLQKHLYFHGGDLKLLSKNPSFTGMLPTLEAAFPDARFIACYRSPEQVVPSQLSSLRPAMRLLGGGRLGPKAQQRVIANLHLYYRLLGERADGKLCSVSMHELKNELGAVLARLYRRFGLELHPALAAEMEALASESRRYRSGHRYRLDDFGLSSQSIDGRFRDVWPLTFGAGGEFA